MRTQILKRGIFEPLYPIKKLKMAEVNRDMILTHAENFKSKLVDYGWLMPIVVSDKGDVIEGHHRIESAKLLKQKTIPAYIVNWIDTTDATDHLKCIISLNNGNKAWTMFDYLKAFANESTDYKIVYNAYTSNSNNVSIGNVINCFFLRTRDVFKKGKSKIEDLDFSNYLLHSISKLKKKHTHRKINSFCVREFIKVAYYKAKKEKKAVEYLLKVYDKMAKQNHLAISSITDFRPLIETYLNEYYLINKEIKKTQKKLFV